MDTSKCRKLTGDALGSQIVTIEARDIKLAFEGWNMPRKRNYRSARHRLSRGHVSLGRWNHIFVQCEQVGRFPQAYAYEEVVLLPVHSA